MRPDKSHEMGRKGKSSSKMSLRAYARHRGVALNAIQAALASGRIQAEKEGDKLRIDPAAADLALAENTDFSKQGRKAPGADDAASRPAPGTFASSRAEREAYQAKLKKLEFEERSGKLVDIDEVRREAFELARAVRNALTAIPDRISAQLAAEVNPHRVHELLAEEIRKALEELAHE